MRTFSDQARRELLAAAKRFERAHQEISKLSHTLTERELGPDFKHSQCCRVGGLCVGGPTGFSGESPCPCGADVRPTHQPIAQRVSVNTLPGLAEDGWLVGYMADKSALVIIDGETSTRAFHPSKLVKES